MQWQVRLSGPACWQCSLQCSGRAASGSLMRGSLMQGSNLLLPKQCRAIWATPAAASAMVQQPVRHPILEVDVSQRMCRSVKLMCSGLSSGHLVG